MRLVDQKTKDVVEVGDTVTTFRGEKGTLIHIQQPYREGTTGRVTVQIGELEFKWYPSVIGAGWEEQEKVCPVCENKATGKRCPSCNS